MYSIDFESAYRKMIEFKHDTSYKAVCEQYIFCRQSFCSVT